MFRLTDPEEPSTKDFDPDYTEDLGDNLPGAMSNQPHRILLDMLLLSLLALYFHASETMIGCMVELLVRHHLVATITPAHPLIG
jgi:hypothetical protein